METHRDIISKWPSITAFADDIGVSANTAKQMRTRNSINGRYWAAAVEGAKQRRLNGVTLEALALTAMQTPEAAQ